MTHPWRPALNSWEVFEERLSPSPYKLYVCRRPEGYTDYISNGFPWGHVYVIDGPIAKKEEALGSGVTIEHNVFKEPSPLEMECVIVAMREKYSAR